LVFDELTEAKRLYEESRLDKDGGEEGKT